MILEVLYEDEFIVAINKPHGLAVHRSKLIGNTNEFALQILRDQLKTRVSPIHRLDRKTAGVLLFSKNDSHTRLFQEALQTNSEKRYLAIVRGYFPQAVDVDHPLINEQEQYQEAQTSFGCLQQVEIPVPMGKFETSRYSLVEAYPKTGRMHQIRKHLNHLRHPIIGDRPHGCNKQNKLFKEKWDMTTMLLHAQGLKFIHPISKSSILIDAPLSSEFQRMITVLGFNPEIIS